MLCQYSVLLLSQVRNSPFVLSLSILCIVVVPSEKLSLCAVCVDTLCCCSCQSLLFDWDKLTSWGVSQVRNSIFVLTMLIHYVVVPGDKFSLCAVCVDTLFLLSQVRNSPFVVSV